MNVAVFGLGYVGSVTAACLASLGHRVIGVDTNGTKVDLINQGRSPVAEPGIGEMITAATDDGLLTATLDPTEAVAGSDVALVCVGTPSRPNGDIDLAYLENVSRNIGAALAELDKRDYVVVIRSTVVPGTADRMSEVMAEVLAASGAGALNPSVAVNPEFLREGQAVEDFMAPPLVMVGADDRDVAAKVLALYDGIEAERQVEPTRLTEMVKYANNSWHAAKVTFANEVGIVSQAMGVDGAKVMELLCRDTKLNISPAYLRPGFAFGGSCLPKDVRALNFMAKDNDIAVPMLSSLLTSNEIQVQRVIDQLVAHPGKTIGVIGLAFKANTDDLRESPLVEVVERMIGKGFTCLVHDRDITHSELIGGNRDYIEREIPHLDRHLVDDVEQLVAKADVVVVSKAPAEVRAALADRPDDQLLIDLVGLEPELRTVGPYTGVAW
ncbi:MAG: nucleotide sugar dehydrogenase [Actinomycetota bacterium]